MYGLGTVRTQTRLHAANFKKEMFMADVIHTDNSGTGVVIGILVAAVIAIGAYFVIQNRDSGPDLSIEVPNASATIDTN